MENEQDRRDFLRKAALVAAAATVAAPTDALAQAKRLRSMRVNLEAKAVMPDGSVKSRAELMTQLGLNPGTAPDAWLNITTCGSNAGALTDIQRNELMKRGLKFKGAELVVKGAIMR